jgi:hypothetical protein
MRTIHSELVRKPWLTPILPRMVSLLALSQKRINLFVHVPNLDLHSKNKDQDQNGNQQNDGVHGNPPLK